jgi:hypothetical protein
MCGVKSWPSSITIELERAECARAGRFGERRHERVEVRLACIFRGNDDVGGFTRSRRSERVEARDDE